MWRARQGSLKTQIWGFKREARMPINETPLEEQEQMRLSAWLTRRGIRHTASANAGKRTIQAGRKLKLMGMSPGFPDITIPIPSGGYHGLYIELKREKGGHPTYEQLDWITFLRMKGYFADFAYGFEEAKQIVCKYLALTPEAA
jgi:hypothetical protein